VNKLRTRILQSITTLIFALLIASCSDTEDGETATGLSVVAFNSTGSTITSAQIGSESINIVAYLKDDVGVALEGETVEFSTTTGTLSAPSGLTNSNGEARVTLDISAASTGVATISVTSTVNDETFDDSLNIQINEESLVEEGTQYFFGGLHEGNFSEGILHADDSLADENGITTIAAGASFGVSVSIVDQDDQPITSAPFEVSFTSTCVESGEATIDETVFSIQGTASATYQDISCAGSQGNQDNIIATVTIDSETFTASRAINLLPEALGSIEFISASPESIFLKGVGGQESSILTFLVKGELGNPQPQRQVEFTLSTVIGGLALSAETATTNASGLATVTVISGSAPAAVRVTAAVESDEGTTLTTQSSSLSVNTGLPDQNSITLAFDNLNPEGRNVAGVEVNVVAYLADSFNNPVPDGTTVNFTAEGGSIDPTCNTENGNCTVIWRSQDPYPDDHRVTILATAVGHEYFVDVDGNNYYSDVDGNAVVEGTVNGLTNEQLSSGFFSISELSEGFVDMTDVWRDDNENYTFDSGEQPLDDDNDGNFSYGDGLFNGPQCSQEESDNCSSTPLIDIRKAGVLIMSGSYAYFSVEDQDDGTEYYSDFNDGDSTEITVASGTDLLLKISDSQLQTLPNGTDIYIDTSGIIPDDEAADPIYTIGNKVGNVGEFNGFTYTFESVDGTATEYIGVLVVTPRGTESSILIRIN